MAKKTLILGGSGFLGSHLADALGETYIYDIRPSPYLKGSQKMIIGDILNRRKLFEVIKGMDTIYHFAAAADIDKVWLNPRQTMKVNILGTANVLEAMRLTGVKRIVFASSLYAQSDKGSLYGTTKRIGEELIKTYAQQCGLEYIILRFGTVYGTRSDESNSIYRLLKEALLTKKIEYKGTGQEVREYIHVRDAAWLSAHLDKYKNETLILTGHQRIKLTELLEMIKEILKDTKVSYYPEKSLSHYKQVCCNYVPKTEKRIIPEISHDFGTGLVEILEEIDERSNQVHQREP